MVIYHVVCFFLCPDADCLRNNLYGAIKSEFERVLNMNKEWSELNKTMQAQIKKKDTYKRGIDTLLTLRSQLIQTLVSFKEELCREDFNSIPFINADGSVIPTLLGNGVRLLGNIDREIKLRLCKTQTYNGITDLIYMRR